MRMGEFYLYGIKKFLLAFLGSLIIVFFISCKKTDLVPSYIHIEKIDLTTDYPFEGTNSNKITDAWVYIDGDLQGIYELPATFPVLATGRHTITIRAGIKINGIAMSRAYYPFYQPYETSIDMTAEQIDTIAPTVTYYENKIHWKEDFETAGISLIKFGDSDTNFIQTQDSTKVFEGASSGIVNLDNTYSYLLSISDNTYVIPQNQSAVFLEFNYKTNTQITVGIYATLTTGMNERVDALYINPNTKWNKLYVNLTPAINSTSSTAGFRVFFEAIKPDSVSVSEILIDNIKLLYTE